MRVIKLVGWTMTAAAAIVAVVFLLSVPVPATALSAQQPVFEAEPALDNARALAEGFPHRADGTAEAGGAAAWIRGQFASLGLEVHAQLYDTVIAGRPVTGINVMALRRGLNAEAIVVCGHYDIPSFVVQGAADNASGIGAIIELARVFAAGPPPPRTLVFLATGTGEYGMAGARRFAEMNPLGLRVGAAISLDFLNMGEAAGITATYAGTRHGYTPPWLRGLANAAIAAESVTTGGSSPLTEWMERSAGLPTTEAGIFLARGAPAVNLAGVPADRMLQFHFHHTDRDVIGNLSARAMEKWGRVAERLVRSVAELPVLPRQSMYYLGLGGRYLPAGAIGLIQAMAFLPLWVAVAGGLWTAAHRPRGFGYWLRRSAAGEWRKCMILFATGLAGLVVARILPDLNLLPKYDGFPATQGDSVLYGPDPWPAVIVGAACAVVFAILSGMGRAHDRSLYGPFLRRADAQEWEDRRLANLVLLGVIALVCMAGRNGFAAVTFLLPPAYLWLLLRPPFGIARAAANGYLVIMSTAGALAAAWFFFGVYPVGPAWWYLLMAVSCGFFAPSAVIVFLAAAALHLSVLAFVTTFVSPPRRYHALARLRY